MRMSRREVLAALRQGAKGTLDNMLDLLELELEGAMLEMEAADDEKALWRAQGRLREIKSLMAAIKHEEGR